MSGAGGTGGVGGEEGQAQPSAKPIPNPFQILGRALPVRTHEETNLLLNPFAPSQQLQSDPALVVSTNLRVWALGKGVFPGYWLLLPLGAGGRGAGGVRPSATLKWVLRPCSLPEEGQTPKSDRMKV